MVKKLLSIAILFLIFAALSGCSFYARDKEGMIMKDNKEAVQATERPDNPVADPVPVLVITANDKVFYAAPEDNSSASALIEKLSEGEITVDMRDYAHFEKVGSLPWSLPRNDAPITTEPGDVILYQGNQITIYYDQNSWNFTRLAKIGNTTKSELLDALGSGSVSVTFRVEWSE